jgi:hypothetical protein
MYKYFFILLLLSSCFSQKKAIRKINKVQIFYPEILAKKSSELYPCLNEVIKIDTIEKIKTDSINKIIETKIDSFKIIMNSIDTIKDVQKLNFYKNKLIGSYNLIASLQEQLKQPSIEKTIKVSDNTLKTQYDSLLKYYNDYRNKYEKLLKIFIYLLVALSISILLNVIKFR